MYIIYFLVNALLAFGVNCGLFTRKSLLDDTSPSNNNSILKRSITSSYYHQLYYWPTNGLIGNAQCCSIGSYCIITNVENQTPNGNDTLTAEFTPTTLYSVPYASITGANNPNDYVVVTGSQCFSASTMTPGNTSSYYYDFLQFYQAAQ